MPLPKAQAVAQETLSVWCSLASRLGVWALKAELEDLCFAVLQVYTLDLLSYFPPVWIADQLSVEDFSIIRKYLMIEMFLLHQIFSILP